MPYNYSEFDKPTTGVCMEYELTVHSGPSFKDVELIFGFSSGGSEVFRFSVKNGKIYDNDGNFFYSFNLAIDEPFEIYGNVFDEYHNFSINRVPVNSSCSKEPGVIIDSFFFNREDFVFDLKCYNAI